MASLRRGILHNALQLGDGSWVWRYRRFAETDRAREFPKFADLWRAVDGLRVPVLLVRGMREQSVVSDADEAELLRRCPAARIARVREAGHSVQGDAPVELARLLADFFA